MWLKGPVGPPSLSKMQAVTVSFQAAEAQPPLADSHPDGLQHALLPCPDALPLLPPHGRQHLAALVVFLHTN